MRYEILDSEGIVVNTILADEEFVAREYPGKYRLVDFQEIKEEIPDSVQEKLDIIITKLEKLEKEKIGR